MRKILLSVVSIAIGYSCMAQATSKPKLLEALKTEAANNIQSGYEAYKKVALGIWDYAEVGFKENKSSLLLQNTLRDNGFTVEAGVAGMPTAFVATYGSGQPVIGILAEFDALPGLSQDSSSLLFLQLKPSKVTVAFLQGLIWVGGHIVLNQKMLYARILGMR